MGPVTRLTPPAQEREWALFSRIAVLALITAIGCSDPKSDRAVEGSRSAGGMTFDHRLSGMTIPQLIQNSRYDVVVATVVDVRDGGATNAVPPRVTLKIDEILRGEPALDRRLAVWSPVPHDVDYGDVKFNPIYKKWAATKLRGPDAGSQFLLFGDLRDTEAGPRFHVTPAGRFPFSPASRKLALDAIRGESIDK